MGKMLGAGIAANMLGPPWNRRQFHAGESRAGNASQPTLTVAANNLTGDKPTISIVTTTAGSATVNAVQTVSFNGTVLFPKSITATTIVVDVPGYLITAHGNIPVVVVNPDYGSSPLVSFPVF